MIEPLKYLGECVLGVHLHNTGYALATTGRRGVFLAHRVVWEQTHGEIPEGHQIHHLCENKACVNVEHLVCLTPAEHKVLHRTCPHGDADRYVNPRTGRSQCRACNRETHHRRAADPAYRAKWNARARGYYRKRREHVDRAT